MIARWVAHYNEQRLHAGLGYLQPAEFYRGDPQKRIQERLAKLEVGRRNRERRNQERLLKAAA